MRYHQAVHDVPVLFESCERATSVNDFDATIGGMLPKDIVRSDLEIPDLPERDVVKHFINLSQMNFGVDNGMYPLGSCTMKYNPKVCDEVVSWPTVADIHPLQDPTTIQGALRLMHELERMLCEIGGVDAVTLQPAAGAAGEFTGVHIVRAWHEAHGETRREIILPDTAHGTNPASAAMVGYDVLDLPSKDGCVDVEALKAAISKDTAAFMLTNPNTLGLFKAIYYGDDDASGNLSCGDTIFEVEKSDLVQYELTNEPVVNKLNPKTIVDPMKSGEAGPPLGTRTDPNPLLRIYGANFNPTQSDGTVRLSSKGNCESTSLGLGTVLNGSSIKLWSDTLIKARVNFVNGWRGTTKWLWVEKGGFKSNCRPLAIKAPLP